MITLNGVELEFSNMGLFRRDGEFIHPEAVTAGYELVFPTEGSLPLREGEREYGLLPGDLLILDPGIPHVGTAIRQGRTAFYWLHFACSDPAALRIPKFCRPDRARTERALRELMHQQEEDRLLANVLLAKLLLSLRGEELPRNRQAYEISEYIRIHAERPLSVAQVAQRFGYHSDTLTRLMKREFGVETKELILRRRLEYLESLLINTDLPLKQIALSAGFEDENAFLKYFKYHEGISPARYRNRFFRIHMNIK